MKKNSLHTKYPPEVCKKIRELFRKDLEAWAPIKLQGELDIQCITTDDGNSTKVAGPWPREEWQARHTKGQERPCLHEDVLTQYLNQVINQIELNPMGVEAQPAGQGADPKSAEFLEGRIRQWEYENNGTLAYLGAAREAATRSYGVWKNEVYYRDKFNVKVCIEPISDPDSVIPGFSKKPDWSDLRRVWEIERMTKEEYVEKYGKVSKFKSAEAFDAYSAEIDGGQWVDDNTVQVCAYWHLDIDEKELLAVSDDAGEIYVNSEDVPNVDEATVVNRRTLRKKTVIKTIFNGFEALEETQYIDPGELSADGEQIEAPEIPFYFVTGRVKYELGKKTIDSLIRKGRVGQLLYDYLISTIQEVIAITGKPVRTGPEGTFDTSTNWSPRDITAYKEWKPVVDPATGTLLPAPVFELYEPPIQALELAKQSILIGIQNAIGMSSTERKDRAAKSGKALDAMQQEMTVGTGHYFGSLRVAQERQYRAMQRILPIIEKDYEDQVGIRDKFGKHKMVDPQYVGRHVVAVGTGKLYQNLQEKQEEFAETLAKIADPRVLMVALPGICRMKGVGPYGEQLAEIFEAILTQEHPELANILNGEDKGQSMSPQAMQMIEQAKQAVTALNESLQEAETKIIELEDERQAKILELQSEDERNKRDNSTKIQVAEINAEAKQETERLRAEIASMKTILAAFGQKSGLDHEARESEADRQHSRDSQESAQASKENMTAAQLAAKAESAVETATE